MNRNNYKVMHVVLGSSGKHELFTKWVVAVFEDGIDAIRWCEKCNEYGQWLSRMTEEAGHEKARYDRYLYEDPDVSEEEMWASRKGAQFCWAIDGSPGQMEEWEEEFEAAHPGGEWFYYHRRELSLMLNPYDEQVYHSRHETKIKYKVVRAILNPDIPFFDWD